MLIWTAAMRCRHSSDMAQLDLPFTRARSERILLRKAVSVDLDAYVEMSADPEVRRYLGGPVSAQRLRARIEARGIASVTEDPGAFVIAEPSSGQLLGTLMLERRSAHRRGHVEPDADELEVSYLLRRRSWGQGLATEAVSLLLRTAAAHLPDQTVLAVTQSSNLPSLALAQRIGFAYAGTFTEFDAEQWLGVGRLHTLGRVEQG